MSEQLLHVVHQIVGNGRHPAASILRPETLKAFTFLGKPAIGAVMTAVQASNTSVAGQRWFLDRFGLTHAQCLKQLEELHAQAPDRPVLPYDRDLETHFMLVEQLRASQVMMYEAGEWTEATFTITKNRAGLTAVAWHERYSFIEQPYFSSLIATRAEFEQLQAAELQFQAAWVLACKPQPANPAAVVTAMRV